MLRPASVLLCAAMALTLLSCDSSVTDPAANLPSDITGNIRLLDECDAAATDHSGITVALEGTEYTAVTGPDGTFRFDKVPAGTYSMKVYRHGYIPYSMQLPLQGKGATFHDMALHPLPAWSVTKVEAISSPADSAVELEVGWDLSSLRCTTLPGQYIALFISDRPDVSSESFKMVTAITPMWDSSTVTRVPLLAAHLRAHGIAKGAPLYVVAYPAADDPSAVQPVQIEAQQRYVGGQHSPVARFDAP